MKEESEYINQLKEIKTELSRIKILLLIIIALCLFGFYGISRSMWDDVAGAVTTVFEVLLVIGFLIGTVLLIAWIVAAFSLSKMNPKIDKELQDVTTKADSEKDNPVS